MAVIYEILKETTKASQMLVDGMTSADVVDVLRTSRPLGFWHMDLKTSLVSWTKEVFEIFEMHYSDKPVNFVEMNRKFHPDDISIRLELLERSVRLKTPFDYVLRIKAGETDYKFIRVAGRYRETEDGFGEYVGMARVVEPNRVASCCVRTHEQN